MPSVFDKGQTRSDESSITGPSNYDPSSRPTVTLSELVSINSTNDCDASVADTSSGGKAFIAEVSSVNGNVAVVEVYDPGSEANDAGGGEAISGEDLSNTTITVRGRGY